MEVETLEHPKKPLEENNTFLLQNVTETCIALFI